MRTGLEAGWQRRWLLGLAVVLMGGLLVPAVASAAPSHFTKVYKVEKHVDLNGGQYVHEHVYCSPGDYAVDGMWRVDHVDQENPQIGVFGDMRDVSVTRSYSDLAQDGDRTKWHFEMTNYADGRAQVKLFGVCLGGKTVENSHQHKIKIRAKKLTAWFPSGHDFSDPALACQPGEVAVGPGFKLLSGGKVWQAASWAGNPLHSSWNWDFVVSHPSSIELSILCLKKKTTKKWGHRHNLRLALKPGWWPQGARTVEKKKVAEKKVACKSAKALVGAWGIAAAHRDRLHFLGMDPRPKSRAFKFWNTDEWNDLPVYVATICIGNRTGPAH